MSYAFIQFDKAIVVITMDSSLAQMNSIAMSNTSSGLYRMDVYENYLVYSIGGGVTVMDCTSVSSMATKFTMTVSANIDDIKIRYPYLIIATGNTIEQYDI